MSRCLTAPFFFLLLPKQFSSSGGDFIFIFNFFPPFVPTGLIPHHLAFFFVHICMVAANTSWCSSVIASQAIEPSHILGFSFNGTRAVL
jgi:hypothetical protein